jgi:heat shock protein HtpX
MWKNRIKTVLLLATMSGLFMLIGSLLGGFKGITIAFFLAIGMNIITYFFSDKIVLALYKAQPLDPDQYSDIYAMVRSLADSMHIPMPKLFLIQTPMANAFATGRNPRHASVAVTSGILSILEPYELRAVLAHELSHVQNRDILISTIAATLATAIGYAATMLRFSSLWSTNRDEQKQSVNPLVILVVSLFMPLAATLIQLAISRSREYLADETGAHLCHDPLALASALEKLERHLPQAHLNNSDVAHASTAPLFIVHPFLHKGFMNLFLTHPPTAKRIERLRQIYMEMTGATLK